MARKKKADDRITSVKRRARLRIGTPKPAVTLTPKTQKPPKHKKKEGLEEA
jgi:hypothetical protein